MKIRRKPKFKKGQIVCIRGTHNYFTVTRITKCWDRDAPENDRNPDRFTYTEIWTEHEEDSLRKLNKTEIGS